MRFGGVIKSKVVFKILLVAAIGGLSSPLAKYALNEIPAFSFIFLRLFGGSILMATILFYRDKWPSWEKFKSFAPVATLWWLNALIFTLGLQRTNADTAQFIHISVPIITAILAALILKEYLSLKQWIGSLVAVIGTVVVIFSNGIAINKSLVGNFLILLSALVFSFYAVLSKSRKFKVINPVEMIFIASSCGALVSFFPALYEYHHNHWVGSVSSPTILATIGAVVSISLFYVGFQKLIKNFGPSIATTNLYLLPAFVVVWSAIILNESLNVTAVLGALIAFVGVGIFSHTTNSKNS